MNVFVIFLTQPPEMGSSARVCAPPPLHPILEPRAAAPGGGSGQAFYDSPCQQLHFENAEITQTIWKQYFSVAPKGQLKPFKKPM